MEWSGQDIDDLGRSIHDAVDHAVSSRDFGALDQTIRRVVDAGGQVLGKVTSNFIASLPRQKKKLYGKTSGKTFGSILKLIFFVPMSISFLMIILSGLVVGVPVLFSPVSLFLSLLFLCGGGWLVYSGARDLKMIERFNAYRRVLGEKTYCSLERLSYAVGKTEGFVRRDVRRMITKGLFLEGGMDREETCLITSHETYAYFEQSRLEFEARKRQEAQSKVVEEGTDRDPALQEVLDRGNAFIVQIRKCNDDIPGEEISAKIDRMEQIVRRIFLRAESHPEIVPDLKKLMDHYLPMTVKLLSAYADMDAQPVQGENIQAAKREIEASLDTLNGAFEKLLDSIFKDTALDVSSDITVLKTLLAQEGLTEDELSKMKNKT